MRRSRRVGREAEEAAAEVRRNRAAGSPRGAVQAGRDGHNREAAGRNREAAGRNREAAGRNREAGEAACRNREAAGAACRNRAVVGSPEGSGFLARGRMGCLDALGAGSFPS